MYASAFRLAVAAATLSASILAMAAPANADITSCSENYIHTSIYVGYCLGSGPSEFWVIVDCIPTGAGFPYTASGAARIAGQGISSVATCGSGYAAANGRIEKHP